MTSADREAGSKNGTDLTLIANKASHLLRLLSPNPNI